MSKSGTGGLKQSFLDTTTPVTQCESCVSDRFHARTSGLATNESAAEQEQSADGLSDKDMDHVISVDKICHHQHGGLCHQSDVTRRAARLVQVFDRALTDHHLKVGQLLQISMRSDSILVFLGICMKKPKLHVLMEAHLNVDDGMVSSLDAPTQPACMTSHQLFHKMLAHDDAQGQLSLKLQLKIEVRSYDLLWQQNRTTIQMGSLVKTIDLDPSAKITIRKPRVKLAFGMKVQKKKRAIPKNVKRKNKKSEREGPKRSLTKPASQSISSERCSSSSSSDSDSSDSDKDIAFEAVEEPVPVSEEMVKEEKRAMKILNTHEKVTHMHDSLVESLHQHESFLASASTSSSSGRKQQDVDVSSQATSAAPAPKAVHNLPEVPPRRPPVKTFFSQTLGVDSVDHAASGRSVCFHCKSRIERQAIRFCWYHDPKKPSAWVHASCLPHVIKENGHLIESRQCLERLKESGTLAHTLQEAVSNALSSLPKS